MGAKGGDGKREMEGAYLQEFAHIKYSESGFDGV